MKKLIAIFLTLALACSLSACVVHLNINSGTESETAPAPTEIPAPNDPTKLTVTMEDCSKDVIKDGQNLATAKWQTATLEEDIPAVQEVLDAFNKDTEESINNCLKDLAESKEESLAAGMTYDAPFTAEETLAVRRADTNIICLLRSGYSYSGGAHGMPYMDALCIDGTTGKTLYLEDVLTTTDGLTDLLISRVEQAWEDAYLFEDWRSTLRDYVDADGGNLLWDLDYDGLTVYFGPYLLAPYAAGTIDVTFPFTEFPDLFRSFVTAPVQ